MAIPLVDLYTVVYIISDIQTVSKYPNRPGSPTAVLLGGFYTRLEVVNDTETMRISGRRRRTDRRLRGIQSSRMGGTLAHRLHRRQTGGRRDTREPPSGAAAAGASPPPVATRDPPDVKRRAPHISGPPRSRRKARFSFFFSPTPRLGGLLVRHAANSNGRRIEICARGS
ncbi:hypothetical protein PHLGIDRAFT_337212 [Phlebiopsis gigantea 11061_1 CR5-6]|uniref:Uncharacterized protein n=1 Tax=Phlebiopsis gigantea (strain 11061_1 CR5-6) TaxID=745531 RepID=A0A0C3NB44_PHLG1|nr:hypothetical protein PHLGIDRAFT_337212 [Phlebiopsis gigantea 11061_1 CR5-6]